MLCYFIFYQGKTIFQEFFAILETKNRKVREGKNDELEAFIEQEVLLLQARGRLTC